MADIKNKNELKRRIELFMDELDYSINKDYCMETMRMMREFIGHASHRLDCANSKIKGLMTKLREYQKLEEQGLLLRLPVTVGSTVYHYCGDFGVILPYTVSSICISSFLSGGIDIVIEGGAYGEGEVLDDFSECLADFQKSFSPTKEEAEQALAEMKGE